MPTVPEGLLRAILDDPDDDAPRLVYADWLEEHGDADHANFIRAQVELARVPDYHPLHVRMWREERDMITGGPSSGVKQRPWRKGLPPSDFKFRRGFPWQVTVTDVGEFPAQAPELFGRFPIQALKLRANYRAPPPDLTPLADSPWLGRLRGLEVSLARLPASAIQTLAASPHAGGLSDLEFSFAGIVEHGLFALLGGPLARRVQNLTLTCCEFGTATLTEAMLRAEGPFQCRSLTYSPSQHLSWADSRGNLFQAPLLRGLTQLALSDVELGPRHVDELVSSPIAETLESLSLYHAKPGVPGVRALANCSASSRLRRLILNRDEIGPVAVKAIAESPHFRNLWVLHLTNNPLGNKGAMALARSPHLTNLAELELMHCEIGDAGAEALLNSPITQNLASLTILDHGKGGLSDAMKQRLRAQFGTRFFG